MPLPCREAMRLALWPAGGGGSRTWMCRPPCGWARVERAAPWAVAMAATMDSRVRGRRRQNVPHLCAVAFRPVHLGQAPRRGCYRKASAPSLGKRQHGPPVRSGMFAGQFGFLVSYLIALVGVVLAVWTTLTSPPAVPAGPAHGPGLRWHAASGPPGRSRCRRPLRPLARPVRTGAHVTSTPQP
jgi:hypothetical protein